MLFLQKIWDNVALQVDADMDSKFQYKVETVGMRLHVQPCLNTKVSPNSVDIILDNFWTEFDILQNKTGSLDTAPFLIKCLTPHACNCNSYRRHELYPQRSTCILSFVSCHIRSKRL